MIIRIMLVCVLLVTVGCGDFTSGSYESDYDGGGSYISRYDRCDAICEDHCIQCWMWYTEQRRCIDSNCRSQCVMLACDSLGYSSRCFDMFREACNSE